jgi:hypothetical protein
MMVLAEHPDMVDPVKSTLLIFFRIFSPSRLFSLNPW